MIGKMVLTAENKIIVQRHIERRRQRLRQSQHVERQRVNVMQMDADNAYRLERLDKLRHLLRQRKNTVKAVAAVLPTESNPRTERPRLFRRQMHDVAMLAQQALEVFDVTGDAAAPTVMNEKHRPAMRRSERVQGGKR